MAASQLCSLMLICVTCSLLSSCAASANYKRVCYYTSWAQWRKGDGKYTPVNVDASLCTHIIFAFGVFDANGRVFAFEGKADENAYAELVNLKSINPKLKLLLAFGGWNFGSTIFSNMVRDGTIRANFISNAIIFLRKHGFDGLDIDWEYPAQRGGVPQDKQNLVTLCKELYEEFQKDGNNRLLLTAAVPAGRATAEAGYDVPALSKYFDFINLMTYDLHGSWESKTGFNSPLYPSSTEVGNERYLNMDAAATWWNDAGMPKEKIIVGFATYSRSFTLTTENSGVGAPAKTGPAMRFTNEAGYASYYEVCTLIELGGGRMVFDKEQKVPYFVQGTMWFGYDNEKSLRIKAQWLKNEGYGGVMFWALDLDDFNQVCSSSTRNYPLIRAVIDELENTSPLTTKPTTKAQTMQTTKTTEQSPSPQTTDQSPQTTGQSPSPQTTGQSPSPQTTVQSPSPQTTVQSPSPQTTVQSPSPQTTVQSPSPQTTVQSPSPQTTVQSPSPQTTVQSPSPQTTVQSPSPQTTVQSPTQQTTERKPNCRGAKGWEYISDWCVYNCAAGFCPRTHCICDGDPPDPYDNCIPVGVYTRQPGMTLWCILNCRLGYCPPTHCTCP